MHARVKGLKSMMIWVYSTEALYNNLANQKQENSSRQGAKLDWKQDKAKSDDIDKVVGKKTRLTYSEQQTKEENQEGTGGKNPSYDCDEE